MNKIELRNFFKRLDREKELKILDTNESTIIGTIMEVRADSVIIDETRAFGDMIFLPFSTIKAIVA